jgi:hypothetical protein
MLLRDLLKMLSFPTVSIYLVWVGEDTAFARGTARELIGSRGNMQVSSYMPIGKNGIIVFVKGVECLA